MSTELVELWRELIEHDRVDLPRHCLDYRGRVSVTDEQIAEAIAEFGDVEAEITLASCSDYGGSSIDRANVRVFRDEFGTEALEDWGAWSESRAYVRLGEPVSGADADDPQDQAERLRALIDVLDGLMDYPLISDESHSELEMELAEEAWDSWLWQDIRSEVETILEERWGDDWQDAPDACEFEDKIREAYYSHDDTWWYAETANSAINENHDRVLKEVLDTVLAGVYPAMV